MSLILEAPKHTQTFAAEVSGRNQSQFSRLLSANRLKWADVTPMDQSKSKEHAALGRFKVRLKVVPVKWVTRF